MSIFTAYGSVDNPQQWMNYLGGNTNSYPSTGTTLYDLSGNNINGTLLSGVTYNSNNGGYITFDGVNDWVDFGYASKPPGTTYDQTSYSFGGWFMFPTTGTTSIPLLIKGGPNTNSWGWSLQIAKNNNTQFIASMVTTTAANSFSGQAGFTSTVTNPESSTTILANRWYFVFGVLEWNNINPATGTARRQLTVYMSNNGAGAAPRTIVAGTPAISTGTWLRGSNVNGWNAGQNAINSPSSTWYNFSCGNIEVYTGIALSQQQVAEVYNKNKHLYGY